MTIEEYKKRAADLRAHMEKPMGLSDGHCVMANKVRPYLPGAENNSMVPLPPPMVEEDLSHMNSPSWQKLKAAGKRNGRRKKR